MSYNFETNFYLPYFDTVQGLVPLPFAQVSQSKVIWKNHWFGTGYFWNDFQIDEPGVNSGTILWYQTPVDFERKLDGSEQIETESNSTIAGSTSSESIPSTTEDISSTDSPSVTFKEKKLNDGQPETKKTTNKKSKQKKKKRINREILQTLLSRKKFYKMLISKLETFVYHWTYCFFFDRRTLFRLSFVVTEGLSFQSRFQWWRMLAASDMWDGWTAEFRRTQWRVGRYCTHSVHVSRCFLNDPLLILKSPFYLYNYRCHFILLF